MLKNLTYRPNLYLGDSIDETKLDKIIHKLERRPLFSGLYLITLSGNPSDQLELFEAKQLRQTYYHKKTIDVIGLAGNKEESVNLVETIVQDCLAARGDCNLKEYLIWQH